MSRMTDAESEAPWQKFLSRWALLTALAVGALLVAFTVVLQFDSSVPPEYAGLVRTLKARRALEGSPFTIEGKTLDGKDLSTADWHGKVVLVQFWAAYCPAGREPLPRVERTYAAFHRKGLEVLGVSNDKDVNYLRTFLKSEPARARSRAL